MADDSIPDPCFQSFCEQAVTPAIYASNDFNDSTANRNSITGLDFLQQSKACSVKKYNTLEYEEELFSMMLDSELYEYLKVSCDVNDFKRRIILLINKLGFTDFAFTLVDTYEEIDGMLYTSPPEMAKTYYNEEFYKHDWLWKYFSFNLKPIFGSTLHNYVNAAPIVTEEILRNQELAKLAKSYGHEDFYALPMKSQTDGHCILFITAHKVPKHTFQSQINSCTGRLKLLCCAIDYICSQKFLGSINSKKRAIPTLTPRPRQLLSYLAFEDCNLYQAAEKMNISVKTANVHIATAKKILGVKNSTGAVAKALEYGLIRKRT